MDLNCDINSKGSIKRLKIFIMKTPKNEVKTIFKYESKIIKDLKTPFRYLGFAYSVSWPNEFTRYFVDKTVYSLVSNINCERTPKNENITK